MVLQEVRRRQLLYNKRHRYWDYCPLTRTQKHTNIQPSKAEVIISIRKSLLYMNFDIFLLVSKDKSFTSLSFLEGRACLFAWCVRECVFVCLCLMFLEKVLFFFFFWRGTGEKDGLIFFCCCFGLMLMEAITDTDHESDGLLFRHRLSGDKKSTNVLWLTKRRADKACTQSVST